MLLLAFKVLWFCHQVYRVSDMELVRVLPSAEDEVNVACFHPFAGGGLVYGTKVCASCTWKMLNFFYSFLIYKIALLQNTGRET